MAPATLSFAAHVNDLQDEVNAVETGLINGVQHVLRPDSSANNRDLALTTARFRDLFLKGTVDVDQGTITADDQAWLSVATWNSGAVTFVHKSTNITDTASAAASVLERWQVGGTTKAHIRKDGQILSTLAFDIQRGAAGEMGTIDNFDLILKRNNTEKARLAATRFTHVQSMARVYRSAVQSIGNAAFTAIQWNNETFDTDGIHDNVTNNTRLTAAVTGKYLVTGHVGFAGSAAGTIRVARILKNGTTGYDRYDALPSATADLGLVVKALVDLAAADYVELDVYQDSGGSLNTSGSEVYMHFQMVYIGE